MPDLIHPDHYYASDVTSPAVRAFAITPSDTVDLPLVARSLWIEVGGTVSIIPLENIDTAPITFTVTAGQILPIAVRRVRVTGTTATVTGLA